MTLEELIQAKLDRLNTIPDTLISDAEKAQKAVFKALLDALPLLKVQNGAIVADVNNLRNVERIIQSIEAHLLGEDAGFLNAATAFTREIAEQANINNQYFRKVFQSFEPAPLYAAITRDSQRKALSLLTQEAVQAQFFQPLRDILTENVKTGARWADVNESLRAYVLGNDEADGRLLRHTKQVAHDTFAIADRSYTETIATALEVEWYRYVGGTVADTRDFCAQRTGKYFHKDEIRAWASQNWQGKNKATTESTIFNYLAGYNCRHSLLPVSEAIVPESDRKRVSG